MVEGKVLFTKEFLDVISQFVALGIPAAELTIKGNQMRLVGKTKEGKSAGSIVHLYPKGTKKG